MYLPKKPFMSICSWALILLMGSWVSVYAFAGMSESETKAERRPQLEQFIIHYTNEVRAKHGLKSLQHDPQLESISRKHSDDMIRRNYTAHITPEGLNPKDRISRYYRSFIGKISENIWLLSGSWKGVPYNQSSSPITMAKRIVDEWMQSPPHRQNILTEGLTHIGIGVSVSSGKMLVTQLLTQKIARFTEPVPLESTPGNMLGISVEFDIKNTKYLIGFENLNPSNNSDKYQYIQKASTIRLPRETGSYRIVVLLEDGQRYNIFKGPSIIINNGDNQQTGPLSSRINQTGTE